MALPDRIQKFLERPDIFIPKVDYYNICSFMSGYDHSSERSFLRGFREWLSSRHPEYKNMWWSSLILHVTFPDPKCSFDELLLDEQNQIRAIEHFKQLLIEFKGQSTAR